MKKLSPTNATTNHRKHKMPFLNMNITTTERKLDRATVFASSMRGQYIISQALCLAIVKMNDDTAGRPHLREESNIADMEYLCDELFPIYKAVQAIDAAVRDDAMNDGNAAAVKAINGQNNE